MRYYPSIVFIGSDLNGHLKKDKNGYERFHKGQHSAVWNDIEQSLH